MRRAVLFDLFNTLVPGGTDALRRSVLTRMAGILQVDPAAYVKAFADTWPERFIGTMGDLASVVRTLAREVGGAPTEEQVATAAALRRGMTAGLLAAVPPTTLSTLDRLRAAGRPLGLVSNTTAESPERFRESRLAARFHTAVFSSELGVKKPDAKIFLAACERLGVAPQRCIYVGDGADDELAAASSLGMRAIRTTEHADNAPDWTGPVVRTLADLPELLA
jgi:putative hydrolase of the HAD superfamily